MMPSAADVGGVSRAGRTPLGLDAAALYHALLDSHPEPTFALGPAGDVIACNRAFSRFVGQPPSAVLGCALEHLVSPPQRPMTTRACADALAGVAQSWRAEFQGPDGTVSVGYVTLAPAIIEGRVCAVQGVARDVTVYEVIEEQLQARVFTDPLTGLANRTQLHESMERAFQRADAPDRVAALFLDLDDFKLVNDGLGHAVGDALLCAVADRLRRATRGVDLVARLGGDEFAILLDGLADTHDVLLVADRIHAALRDPVDLSGRPITAAASIGIAHWDGSATPAELLRNADLAMYRAKAAGKSRFVVFDLHMQAAARTRLELASDLREAIRAQEIHAVFQPIVDLVSGRAVKAEALARWTHPTRGVVPPSVFIPLAEETGLIDELGALMLRHACRQLGAWQRAWQQVVDAPPSGAPSAERRRAMGVTVNVSGHQVDHGTLGDAIRAALDESGADAVGLTVELTESVAMRQPERLLEMLTELAASGVTLAIDDFGTGYSSLSYLHRFPVDVLKIDKSFVDHLGEEPRNAHAETLVRTIVSIARSLGLQTVAEGVETGAQRDALVALGCDLGQGYLFGRPVLAAELDVSR